MGESDNDSYDGGVNVDDFRSKDTALTVKIPTTSRSDAKSSRPVKLKRKIYDHKSVTELSSTYQHNEVAGLPERAKEMDSSSNTAQQYYTSSTKHGGLSDSGRKVRIFSKEVDSDEHFPDGRRLRQDFHGTKQNNDPINVDNESDKDEGETSEIIQVSFGRDKCRSAIVLPKDDKMEKSTGRDSDHTRDNEQASLSKQKSREDSCDDFHDSNDSHKRDDSHDRNDSRRRDDYRKRDDSHDRNDSRKRDDYHDRYDSRKRDDLHDRNNYYKSSKREFRRDRSESPRRQNFQRSNSPRNYQSRSPYSRYPRYQQRQNWQQPDMVRKRGNFHQSRRGFGRFNNRFQQSFRRYSPPLIKNPRRPEYRDIRNRRYSAERRRSNSIERARLAERKKRDEEKEAELKNEKTTQIKEEIRKLDQLIKTKQQWKVKVQDDSFIETEDVNVAIHSTTSSPAGNKALEEPFAAEGQIEETHSVEENHEKIGGNSYVLEKMESSFPTHGAQITQSNDYHEPTQSHQHVYQGQSQQRVYQGQSLFSAETPTPQPTYTRQEESFADVENISHDEITEGNPSAVEQRYYSAVSNASSDQIQAISSQESKGSDEGSDKSKSSIESNSSLSADYQRKKKRRKKKYKRKHESTSESDSSSDEDSGESDVSSRKKKEKRRKLKRRNKKKAKRSKRKNKKQFKKMISQDQLQSWLDQQKIKIRDEIMKEVQVEMLKSKKNVDDQRDVEDAEILESNEEMVMSTVHGFVTGIPLTKDEDAVAHEDTITPPVEEDVFSIFKSDDDLDVDSVDENWKRKAAGEKQHGSIERSKHRGEERRKERRSTRHKMRAESNHERRKYPKETSRNEVSVSHVVEHKALRRDSQDGAFAEKESKFELKDQASRNVAHKIPEKSAWDEAEETDEKHGVHLEHRESRSDCKNKESRFDQKEQSKSTKLRESRFDKMEAKPRESRFDKTEKTAYKLRTNEYSGFKGDQSNKPNVPRHDENAQHSSVGESLFTQVSEMDSSVKDGIAIATLVRNDVYKQNDFWKGSSKRALGENVFNAVQTDVIDTTKDEKPGHWVAPFSDVQMRLQTIADPTTTQSVVRSQRSSADERPESHSMEQSPDEKPKKLTDAENYTQKPEKNYNTHPVYRSRDESKKQEKYRENYDSRYNSRKDARSFDNQRSGRSPAGRRDSQDQQRGDNRHYINRRHNDDLRRRNENYGRSRGNPNMNYQNHDRNRGFQNDYRNKREPYGRFNEKSKAKDKQIFSPRSMNSEESDGYTKPMKHYRSGEGKN